MLVLLLGGKGRRRTSRPVPHCHSARIVGLLPNVCVCERDRVREKQTQVDLLLVFSGRVVINDSQAGLRV